MSALEGLPSFSETAFSKTNPEVVYKEVRRIGDRKPPREPSTEGGCRSILIKQRRFPEVKDILLINGVDPKCGNVIKFKSTDSPLPFLYSDSTTSTPSTQKPQPQQQPSVTPTTSHGPPSSSSHAEEPRERKRPKRDSERRVSIEVAIQPERKRPKRESERRAEAAERQGK